MTNLAELIPILLDKTKERKLEWEALASSVGVGNSFIARVGDTSIELYTSRTGDVAIALRDAENRVVERENVERLPTPFDDLLTKLYDAARRRALNTDDVLQSL